MNSSVSQRSLSRSRLAHALALLPWIAPLAAAPQWAWAQETTLPPVKVTDAQTAPLDRPTSTGSNLDLSIKQTPASVDILSRTQLEERGDTSVVNAVTRALGLSSLGHPGNSGSSLSARGFTDTTSVMRLYDGMRQYGGVGVSFPFDTWSVDRIEVLRGPAAVIHGDGAIGGVINVVPKKPTRGPIRSEVQATVGTEGKAALGLGSGGALDDRWSYRVDLSGDRADGWVDRGDSKNLTFSGAVQLDLSPEWVFKLSHAQGKQEPKRYFGTPLVDGKPLAALREKNYNVADSEIVYRDRWTDLWAQWTPSANVAVRSRLYQIDSDRHWRNAEGYTHNPATGLIDRSDNTEIAHDQTQTGNTTDASYSADLFGRANQVAVGFDVSRSRFKHTNNTYSGSSPSVDPYNPEPGLFVSDAPFIPRYQNEARQYALFAEDRLALTRAWSVVAGVRYDHAEVKRTDLVAGTQAFDTTYSNTGWRLGAVFQVDPDLSLYAQYAQAADPVAGMLMLSPANSTFDLSTGKQLEVGLKQSFWDRKGDWTLAVYEIRKDNLLTRDSTDPSKRVQVGERSSKGIEASVAMAVTPTVQVDANAALLKARFDDFSESVGGVAVSRNGNVPPDVPERLANLWVSWRVLPDWTASGGVRYVGKRYVDNANAMELPSYTTTDLALRWRPTSATTVTLRGLNVFDKLYYTTAYYTATQWFVAEGRRVELTVNQQF